MIDAVTATADRISTETDEESDGTLVWDFTDLGLVEVTAGQHTCSGYTYSHPAAQLVVLDKAHQRREGLRPGRPRGDVGADADISGAPTVRSGRRREH